MGPVDGWDILDPNHCLQVRELKKRQHKQLERDRKQREKQLEKEKADREEASKRKAEHDAYEIKVSRMLRCEEQLTAGQQITMH